MPKAVNSAVILKARKILEKYHISVGVWVDAKVNFVSDYDAVLKSCNPVSILVSLVGFIYVLKLSSSNVNVIGLLKLALYFEIFNADSVE